MIANVNSPKVSVVLPIRNEEEFISDTLLAVCMQTYPSSDYEIIIADGLSTDRTLACIATIQADFPQQHIQVIVNPGQIVSTGLNAAIRVAKGDIIIRIDGHTTIDQDYIYYCVELIQRGGVENVGGKMISVSDSFVGHAVSLATSSPFGVGGARFHYSDKEELVDTVYLGAWPRRIFEKIGGFDEELIRDQDDEFNYRLRANGGKILLSPKIKSKYYPRNTLNKLFKQYYQYGFWKIRVLQKHPLQMRPRQFVPFLFVFSVLFALVLTSIPMLGNLFLMGILGSYLIANGIASFLISKKSGWRYFFILSLIFTILHVSYGAGFMVGLLRFIHRWGDKEGSVPQFEFNAGMDQ